MELYEHGTQSLAIDNTSILQLTNGALQGPHLITTNKIIALQQTYVSPDTLELFLPPQHGLLFILGSHDKMTNTLRKKCICGATIVVFILNG